MKTPNNTPNIGRKVPAAEPVCQQERTIAHLDESRFAVDSATASDDLLRALDKCLQVAVRVTKPGQGQRTSTQPSEGQRTSSRPDERRTLLSRGRYRLGFPATAGALRYLGARYDGYIYGAVVVSVAAASAWLLDQLLH